MELITPIFADASNSFWGQWVIVALGIFGGLGGLAAVASYFATRREFEALDKRVEKVEETLGGFDQKIAETHIELIANGEKRSTSIHRRLDPLIENIAAMKGAQEAFGQSFDNYTRAVEAQTQATIAQAKAVEALAKNGGRP